LENTKELQTLTFSTLPSLATGPEWKKIIAPNNGELEFVKNFGGNNRNKEYQAKWNEEDLPN